MNQPSKLKKTKEKVNSFAELLIKNSPSMLKGEPIFHNLDTYRLNAQF
jgi:hypothetical protein